MVRKRVTSGPAFGEQRIDQFEIAGGDLIEVKALGAGVEAEGVNVAGFVLLRGADVVDDGSCGDGGGGMTGEAEALEGAAAELALEERDGEIRREGKVVDRGASFDLGQKRIEGRGVSFGTEGATG